jgi:excinuclease ABC subunit A
MDGSRIVIKNASQHNLKNIDLEIPRDKLIVITGVSGSGKSSLAFDTIYAEGQRRYVESLSAYARQFLEQMEKPDVELIEGLSPAVSIEQRSASRNPRSTLGTITEIYDYLRLLFARIGKPHCYKCGREISSQSVQQIVDQVMAFTEGDRIQIMAPIARSKKGEFQNEFQQLLKNGFIRARVDGEIVQLAEDLRLEKYKKHDIDVVVDRLILKDGIESRLADSIETALKLANGIVTINSENKGDRLFSEKLACIECGISLPELAPRMFSFNSPHGACPACGGLGFKLEISPRKVVVDESKSIKDGCLLNWSEDSYSWRYQMVKSLAKHYNIDLSIPFQKLPEKSRQIFLYGSDEAVDFKYEGKNLKYSISRRYEGIIPMLMRLYRETKSEHRRQEIEKYMSYIPCPECRGNRLRPESLAVTINGKNIADYSALSIKEAVKVFNNLKLSTIEKEIADRILKEIRERLAVMLNLGLEYLELNRPANTLSGGENQRIRLATQIGSSLMGVLYVLDEPSIGLHQRDNRRLLETLFKMRDLGNTVIIVEHDETTIRSADYVVDLGPGAGENGGYVVFSGKPIELLKSKKSLTGKYLSGLLNIEVPKKRRSSIAKYITILGAEEHNLKNIDVKIPLGLFTVITGVSGSGKSTLIDEILYRRLARKLYCSPVEPGKHRKIEGIEYIDKVINITQAPIGRTPRSNPATYTGVFSLIRNLFSQMPEARMRGYRAGRFSFNVKGGRCEACQGAGIIKIEMHFLPDVYVTCDVCKGKRYNRETLEVKYKGKNISEVLDMTVTQALELMHNIPNIKNKLQTLYDVGMGYIRLGQPATTLSGGEAQRVKLSRELSKKSTGGSLYILDEPTTGLHFDDIKKLLSVLNRLVDGGNTVVVIEHNLDVIKTADYIIDLGPEGGDEGGWIVVQGKPEEVAEHSSSYTGKYLRKLFNKEIERKKVS